MGYPFIISYNGDQFARVNHDGSWSVDWDKTLHYSFEAKTPQNSGTVAFAVALLGAKDNFFLTAWNVSDEWKDKWQYKEFVLDIEKGELSENSPVAEYSMPKRTPPLHMARVNYDGSWSVNWPTVMELAKEPLSNYKTVSLVAVCHMLLAGKHRFPTTPWEVKEAEEE